MPYPFSRAILTAGLAFSLVVPCAGADVSGLPDLGDESASAMSAVEERKLGENFMRMARRSLDIVDDPELNQYIQALGNRLVAHNADRKQDFQFFIVRDPALNAFAVPGGFVGVNTGLILATQDEAELAAVLAHEIAHITQRHLPRLIAESQRVTVPAMAALIAAVLLGGQAGEAAIALTSATVVQSQIAYTRAFEQESDRLGMQTLAAAGFDARAMPSFFERLQNWGRIQDSSLPDFLRTHPITSDRIAESRDRAERYPARARADSSGFALARAKLRAQGGVNPAETTKTFKANLESGKYNNADAERYGYALALFGNKQYDDARREIGILAQRDPGNPSYRIAQAEIEMAAGRYDAALATYAAAHKANPASHPLARRYAAALLKTGHAREAKELLKGAVRNQPGDPALYQMLATAHGETGARLEAHQALAEHYFLMGNNGAALNQLQIAKQFASNNFYALSSIEARMNEIKDEQARYQSR